MDRGAKLKIIHTVNSIFLCLIFFFCLRALRPLERLNWKIYDKLAVIETKLTALPAPAADILLVVLDNHTLSDLPSRWPYPRSYFATVIDNLNEAGAKIIGFDFVFTGESSPEEDSLLKESLERGKNIVLAATINEQGEIDLFSNHNFCKDIPVGIVTKLQDNDEIIRKNLTFLVNEHSPNQILLSWEMQILNGIKYIDRQTIRNEGRSLLFGSSAGENWKIPVNPRTMDFLIHFRANTADFSRISFSDVFKKNFSPEQVKDKIVLIGFLSQTFGDIHNTPLRWLPGLTLNANAFLTLYTRSFIEKMPAIAEFTALLIGVLLSCFFTYSWKFKLAGHAGANVKGYAINNRLIYILWYRRKTLLMIGLEIIVFFAVSLFLLIKGRIWDYTVFPAAVIFCPLLGEKIFALLWHPKTILFAHKDTVIRDLFYRALSGLRYRIITAYSNSEILELLKNQRPGYIILDRTDTGASALDTAKKIESIDPSIIVIIPQHKPDPRHFIRNILLDIRCNRRCAEIPDKESLPAKKDIASQPAPADIRPHDKKPPQKLHILVIDDEQECAELIKHYFSKRGHSIDTAYSGEEALQKLNGRKPDIVILDIRMQGIDGLVTLRAIKNLDKNLPVIMSTAVDDRDIIEEANKLGADYYLTKPFGLAALENAIVKFAPCDTTSEEQKKQ